MDRTAQALLSTFGATFQLWRHDDAWRLVHDGTPDGGQKLGDELGESPDSKSPPAELLSFFDLGADTPRSMPATPSSDLWLAIPLTPLWSAPSSESLGGMLPSETLELVRQFEHDQQERIVAVGRVSGTNEQIATKLAELFLRDIERETNDDRLLIENRTLSRQITEDLEELSFLRATAESLDVSDRSFDLNAMAEAVLPTLRTLCESRSMVLLEVNSDDPQLEAKPIVWCGPRTVADSVCNRLIQAFRDDCVVEPVVRNNFHETTDAVQYPGVEGFVLVPIIIAEKTTGWLLAINRENERSQIHVDEWYLSFLEFGTHEASLMSSAATIMGTHAHNMDLLGERERLVVSIVRALVTAIEAKDEYTRGHSERVALYSKRLAVEMEFPADHCERLYLTGLLHDVGKIGVSDAVLRKPGALSPEEFDEIKQHPDKGWAILIDVEPLTYVLPGLLYHHERFDGAGYPDGLAGEDIPIDGRILAVADAYDAMTSDRPYRKGMPHEKAEMILRSGMDEQWDANIVEVFCRVVADILEIKENYRPRIQNRRKKPQLGLPTQTTAAGDRAKSSD
jgi:HD-GYP domain-containing protein (c-di-GMP phosphodiesterase class II)